MENFDFILEIIGQDGEKFDALLALPENGKGVVSRAIEPTRSKWPEWYGELVDLALSICDDEKWGYVYVIKGTHKGIERHKIGKANDLNDRLKLFNVKLPFDIETEIAFRVPDALRTERRLHSLMAGRRIAGEWFDLSADAMHKVKLAGLSEELSGWARVMERISSATREGNRIPASQYIEYLESLLVMNAIPFEKKETM